MGSLPLQRWMRKRGPAAAPVTSSSLLLFRLGELCNNRCPMCSNTGDPALWRVETEALLERVERVVAWGFRRVIVTGGEPTIHPGFWDVVERFSRSGLTWDINTQGRAFADRAFADRAMATGLDRAIVSLHSHLPAASAIISGNTEAGHAQTVAGIDHLAALGARLLLNLVLTRHNVDHVADWVRDCHRRWGDDVALKVCFPSLGGKGGSWDGIDLRFDAVQSELRRAAEAAKECGLRLCYEALPHCVHGDAEALDVSRSGFGESHYLDDARGDRFYAIAAIEAELRIFPSTCQSCAALSRCCGVEPAYLRRHGASELRPMVATAAGDEAAARVGLSSVTGAADEGA